MIIFGDKIHQIYFLRNGILLKVNKIHDLNVTIVRVAKQFAPRSYDDGIIPFLQLQISTF